MRLENVSKNESKTDNGFVLGRKKVASASELTKLMTKWSDNTISRMEMDSLYSQGSRVMADKLNKMGVGQCFHNDIIANTWGKLVRRWEKYPQALDRYNPKKGSAALFLAVVVRNCAWYRNSPSQKPWWTEEENQKDLGACCGYLQEALDATLSLSDTVSDRIDALLASNIGDDVKNFLKVVKHQTKLYVRNPKVHKIKPKQIKVLIAEQMGLKKRNAPMCQKTVVELQERLMSFRELLVQELH